MLARKQEKQSKSERRREEILQRAAELFDRQGYSQTSLDDIARAIGIKREALYYYFQNRPQILLAVIRPQSEALIEGLATVTACDALPVEKLRLAIRNHLKRFDRHCLEMTVTLRDGLLEDAPEVRSEMARIWKDYERMWVELIADGQRQGAFTPGSDAKMVAFGILGMCNWLARWFNPRKSVEIDELIDTYFGMVAFGIVPRPPS